MLIPNIFEFCLNNIRMGGGFHEDYLYGVSDVVEEIIKTLALTATKLMKLKLTNMYLKDEGII